MGSIRNGARTFLVGMAYACKLSRMPGFRNGLRSILGSENGDAVFALWEPLCLIVDSLIAADNYFNRKDYLDDDDTGEDEIEGGGGGPA